MIVPFFGVSVPLAVKLRPVLNTVKGICVRMGC